MVYVDGWVMAVPKGNRDAFIDHAEQMDGLFIKHGALRIVETWASDVPNGEVTSFPMAVKCKDDEVVSFGFCLWPSKAVRDESMPKVMAEMQEVDGPTDMPFDGQRMIFGGFEALVDLKA